MHWDKGPRNAEANVKLWEVHACRWRRQWQMTRRRGPRWVGVPSGRGGSPERLARRLDFVLRLAAIAGR